MGKAKGLVQGSPVRVEIKSVNHRFCEISFRSPGRFSSLEIPAGQFIREQISRGHVDVFVFEEKTPQLSVVEIDAFKNYHDYLSQVARELKLTETVTLQHLLPGVGGWIYKEMDTAVAWQDLRPILNKALKDLISMREMEGSALKSDISDRLLTIENIKNNVSSLCENVQVELADRLEKKIAEKIQNRSEIDAQRFHQEIVFYLERMDISEELKRLDSHLKQFKDFLTQDIPVGRKGDFLIQEFNREFNTIGSKSQNAQIAHLVVAAKVEVEKIREQIQNIE